MPLQLRRGTEAERLSMEQPLQEGEPLFITDENTLYIGVRNSNGELPLPRDLAPTDKYTNEEAQDAVAAMFEAGIHPGLDYFYDDAQDAFNIVLNLSNISQSIVPSASSIYDLGSYDYKFKDLYLSGNSLHLGDAVISSTNSTVNLPAGSTVGGVQIGSDGGDGSPTNTLTAPNPDDPNVYLSPYVDSDSNIWGNVVIKENTLGINMNGTRLRNTNTTFPDLRLSPSANGNVKILNGNLDMMGGAITNTNPDDPDVYLSPYIDAGNGVYGSIVISSISGGIDTQGTRIQSRNPARPHIRLRPNPEGNGTVRIETGNLDMRGNSIINTSQINAGQLTFENNVIKATGTGIKLEADNFQYSFDTEGLSITDTLANGLFNTTTVPGISINSQANTADSSAEYGDKDILSLIQFSAFDLSNRIYGLTYIGTQINPNAPFDTQYASQKFFVGVLSHNFLEDEQLKVLSFDSRGYLAVNQESANATVDINGFMKLAIMDAEPTNVEDGMIAIADGINWDPAVTGMQTLVARLNGVWVSLGSHPHLAT